MVPDSRQLQRIHALAMRAGLKVQTVDVDLFLTTYQPSRYHGFALPPAFVYLCALCDPGELSRVFIVPALGDPGRLRQLNDNTRRELTAWPNYLVQFGLTGDESFCFAYNAPDSAPAVVTVDSYRPYHDPDPDDGEQCIDWTWFAGDFEGWLAIHADWLPQADAKSAAWNAEFKARQGNPEEKPAPRGSGTPHRDKQLRRKLRRQQNEE